MMLDCVVALIKKSSKDILNSFHELQLQLEFLAVPIFKVEPRFIKAICSN